jgi:hypothetical protein
VNAVQVEAHLHASHQGPLTYNLLRADLRQSPVVRVQPLSQGRVSLFYYLSLVGFFSLLVGTIVMLRRPPDRVALHFYAICLLFFLMYSLSYTGQAEPGGLDALLGRPPGDPAAAGGVPALLPVVPRAAACRPRAAG